jgi:hypothetical protein
MSYRVLVLALLAMACRAEQRPAPAGAEPSAAASAAAPADPCAALAVDFARRLDGAAGTCQKDADCACYPGGTGERAGCGGITDRTSADALQAIAKQFRIAHCPYARQCAPWTCTPRCRDGRCAAGH